MTRIPLLRAALMVSLAAAALPVLRAESKGAGSTLFPFLKVPLSARMTAMGGSLGASADDAAMINTNPAGLMDIERVDIQASFLKYFEESSLQSLSVAFPLRIGPEPRQERLLGAEFARNRIGLGFELRQFKAEDKAYSGGTDGNGNIPLDDFDVTDRLLEGSLSFAVHPRVSVGATMKSLTGKIQDKTTSLTAFDGGAILRLNSRWATGFAVQNFGGGKKYAGPLGTAEYPLPLTTRFSASYQMAPWLAVADLSYSRDEILRKSAGLEWSANRFVRFRGGAFHATTLEFTGGLGIQIAGPQKTAAPVYRTPVSARKATTTLSPMSQQIIARMAGKLIAAYKESQTDPERTPSLAVLPFTSKETAASPAQAFLHKKIAESGAFRIFTDGSPSDYIVSGTLESGNDRYSIDVRLINMEDAETIGSDRTEIAIEDFYEKKLELGKTPARPRESMASDASRVNIGLDYGLSTHQDLGLTHTVTLKILY